MAKTAKPSDPFRRFTPPRDSVRERIEEVRKKRDERRRVADKILAKPLRKR